MMLDRMEGNAELKTSVHQMLASRRLTHSVLLVGEEGLGAGFAARCIAADYLYPAGGAPAEALLRGECCRALGKAGKRDSGQIETGAAGGRALPAHGRFAGRGAAHHPQPLRQLCHRAGVPGGLCPLLHRPWGGQKDGGTLQ